MGASRRLAVLGLMGALLACAATTVCAQVTVLSGGELSLLCTRAARAPARDPSAIDTCTHAIDTENVTGRDLAGLYVNRGVLEMRESAFGAAQADFDVAASIAPALGEAWVDRGAVRIAQRQWRPGLEDIDRGLTLGPTEPEKAYFNRALAEEHLGDVRAAYFDYLKAEALAPAWAAPKQELARFRVSAAR